MARRSVQFWRIGQVNGDELTRPFPGRRVAEVLKAAEASGIDRHYACTDGTVLLAHSRALSPHPVVLLDRVRDSNLPSVGDPAGHRKPLPLAPGDHLLETTYFAFLKHNVIAVLVDLLKERFIAHIEVDADAFNDPSRSTREAIAILNRQALDNGAFFARTLPEVKGSPDNASIPELMEGGQAAAASAVSTARDEESRSGAGSELVRG